MDFWYRLFRSKQGGHLVSKVLDLDKHEEIRIMDDVLYPPVSILRLLPRSTWRIFDGSASGIKVEIVYEIGCQLLVYGWEVAEISSGGRGIYVLRDVPEEAAPQLRRHLRMLGLRKMTSIEAAFRRLLLEGQAAWRNQYGTLQPAQGFSPFIYA